MDADLFEIEHARQGMIFGDCLVCGTGQSHYLCLALRMYAPGDGRAASFWIGVELRHYLSNFTSSTKRSVA